jgi:membrane protein implicated in regulation of membrane protease activity
VIGIDLAQTIYAGCVLIGGGLLLITVVLDDLLGGLFDFLHVDLDLGGVSLMPLLLSFISMFGVGGLIGLNVLELTAGQSAIVGGVAGAVGAGIAYVLFGFLRRAEAPEAFSLNDLVGSTARVSVSIPARRSGSVLLTYAGSTHNLTATAEIDLAAGSTVTVTGIAGSSLVVAPVAPALGGTPDV